MAASTPFSLHAARMQVCAHTAIAVIFSPAIIARALPCYLTASAIFSSQEGGFTIVKDSGRRRAFGNASTAAAFARLPGAGGCQAKMLLGRFCFDEAPLRAAIAAGASATADTASALPRPRWWCDPPHPPCSARRREPLRAAVLGEAGDGSGGFPSPAAGTASKKNVFLE